MALRYVGNGAGLPDVPARDLSDDEVKDLGGEAILLKSGLYERAGTNKPRYESKAETKPEVKEA